MKILISNNIVDKDFSTAPRLFYIFAYWTLPGCSIAIMLLIILLAF